MKKPCIECPFRKIAAPGYLGDSSYDPIPFLQQLDRPNGIPCHMTIDWDAEDVDKQEQTAPRCQGSLHFMCNAGQLPRNPELASLRNKAGKNDDIIANKRDFILYHS